jgi:hypothetical protein
VFLARRVLGRSLRPPIDAIIPASEETDPGLTTRQRVAKQTSGAMCQSCHRIINPLGFAFENYDAIGRFRTEENGNPIDAAGAYVTSLGDQVEFNSSKQLGDFLAASPEVHQAIVKQLFQFFVKQPLPAYGLDQSDSLTKSFQNHGFKVRPLMRDIGLLICQPPSIPKPPSNPTIANSENP